MVANIEAQDRNKMTISRFPLGENVRTANAKSLQKPVRKDSWNYQKFFEVSESGSDISIVVESFTSCAVTKKLLPKILKGGLLCTQLSATTLDRTCDLKRQDRISIENIWLLTYEFCDGKHAKRQVLTFVMENMLKGKLWLSWWKTCWEASYDFRNRKHAKRQVMTFVMENMLRGKLWLS